MIPDTLFLRDGKYDFILMNDQHFACSVDTKTKFTDIKIRVRLYECVRERKKDTERLGIARQMQDRLNLSKDQGKLKYEKGLQFGRTSTVGKELLAEENYEKLGARKLQTQSQHRTAETFITKNQSAVIVKFKPEKKGSASEEVYMEADL